MLTVCAMDPWLGEASDEELGVALRMPAADWIPEWLEQRTGNQLLILLLAVLSPVGLLPRANRKYLLPVLAGCAALLVWFFGAPNWRFGYGVVLGLTAFTSAVVLRGSACACRNASAADLHGRAGVPSGLPGPYHDCSVRQRTIGERLALPMDYNPRVRPSARLTACRSSAQPPLGHVAMRPSMCSRHPPNHSRPRSGLGDGFYSWIWSPCALMVGRPLRL